MLNLILDTDPGDDPDDLFVLTSILLNPDKVKLLAVITGDEIEGDLRSRLVWEVLSRTGRTDIPIFTGENLGHNNYLFSREELTAPGYYSQPFSSDKIAEIIDFSGEKVEYLCIEGATNIAKLLTAEPKVSRNLQITQMGGAINYRNPEKTEHNFRIDPVAANNLLHLESELRLVLSDTTFKTKSTLFGPYSDVMRRIERAGPSYEILTRNCYRFFEQRFPECFMSDMITYFSLLKPGFLDFKKTPVSINLDGRMSLNDSGLMISISQKKYNLNKFNRLLITNLFPYDNVQ